MNIINNYMVILRGVSGAGKSTYARKLQQRIGSKWSHMPWMNACAVVSTDNYFIRPDGTYDFNGKRLSEAHAWCLSETKRLLELKVRVLIVDNTNTRKWEYQKFIELASQHDYKVKEKIIGSIDPSDIELYSVRNAHGVPKDTIRKMMQRFEK